MALRTSQRLLLAKEESTYGTDPRQTGMADATLVAGFKTTLFRFTPRSKGKPSELN